MPNTLFNWRIRDIENKANTCERRLWEIDSLNSKVRDLEIQVRNLENETKDLRYLISDLTNLTNERLSNLENNRD